MVAAVHAAIANDLAPEFADEPDFERRAAC
jgi:hypothetical protein